MARPVLLLALLAASCGPRASDLGRDAGPDLGPADAGSRDVGPPPARVLIASVIDGDTVTLSASQSLLAPDGVPLDEQRVRLIGVDTPEIAHDGVPAECFGDEAAAFTREALEGRFVTLEYDARNGYRDGFGRLLAYVMVNGAAHNEALVRDGYAYVFRRYDYAQKGAYLTLEAEARGAGRGLWSACP